MTRGPDPEEVDRFLSRLAQLLRENEKAFSLEFCRDRYNALQGEEKSTLERLARILRGRRQKKVPTPNDGDHPSGRDDTSVHGRGSENNENASETEPRENGTDQSEDEGTDPVDDSLLGTNFENCSVCVPRSLQKVLEDCKSDPEIFFSELSEPFERAGGFGKAFCNIRQDKKHSDLLTIYRRFYLRNFYLKVVRSGHHTTKSWRWNARSKLAEEIAKEQSINLSVTEIAEELSDFVEIGRGYETWVQNLGDPGYLIAMPLEITETEYTRRQYRKLIPMATKRLRHLGIDRCHADWELRHLGDHISNVLETSILNPGEYLGRRKRKELCDDNSSAIDKSRPRKARHIRSVLPPTAPPPSGRQGLAAGDRSDSVGINECDTRLEDTSDGFDVATVTHNPDSLISGHSSPGSSTNVPLERQASFSIENRPDINTDAQRKEMTNENLNNTHPAEKSTDAMLSLDCGSSAFPPVAFDPNTFVQGNFEYFDAQPYLFGPEGIASFDAQPYLEFNSPIF